jgi:hypothetical protein
VKKLGGTEAKLKQNLGWHGTSHSVLRGRHTNVVRRFSHYSTCGEWRFDRHHWHSARMKFDPPVLQPLLVMLPVNPNLIETVIASSPIVFITLVLTCHAHASDASPCRRSGNACDHLHRSEPCSGFASFFFFVTFSSTQQHLDCCVPDAYSSPPSYIRVLLRTKSSSALASPPSRHPQSHRRLHRHRPWNFADYLHHPGTIRHSRRCLFCGNVFAMAASTHCITPTPPQQAFLPRARCATLRYMKLTTVTKYTSPLQKSI